MKVILPQFVEAKLAKPLSAVKRIAKGGLQRITNAFERSPQTDVFVSSTKFSKPDVSKADQKYIETINAVPVMGVGKKEQPILYMVQESMFNMLKLTKGKSAPYKEILFAHTQNPQVLACVYYPANVLVVNKLYLENIDGLIGANIEVFKILEWAKKGKDGKYKIPDLLRNPKSEKFEKRLNEYTPEWSLKEKFDFDTLGTYYRNLASLAFQNPAKTIEKIFSDENNCKILKENGLFDKRKDVSQLGFAQDKYLHEIGKYCHLPEDSCLVSYPEIVFNHEYIHKLCFDNFSEDYLKELHSQPVIQKWKDDKKIQSIANKVSLNAVEDPMEYIAEVGAGIAGRQKFDDDIMSLYESLNGPKL